MTKRQPSRGAHTESLADTGAATSFETAMLHAFGPREGDLSASQLQALTRRFVSAGRQAIAADLETLRQAQQAISTSRATDRCQPGASLWDGTSRMVGHGRAAAAGGSPARTPAKRHAFLDAACAASESAPRDVLIAAHERRGALDGLRDHVMTPLRRPPDRAAAESALARSVHARYRVLERLGGGGMGVVYRARDERLERDVALKFLPPHLSADGAAKRRFLVEARAAAAVEHPNICTVHEIGETDDGQLYIVMACYDGETVECRVARGPLGVDEALRIAAEVARGLAKAHERGIVHRDVKPANVVLTSDALVKILDFGIAKLADAGITQTGSPIGTVAYMSPEQAFGEAVDHRTDLWSLGVVLYEMLTGVRPFRGPGEQAVLFSILTAVPEPTASRRAGIPPGVDDVLRRALAKQPADRFATAAEMAAALASPATVAVPSSAPRTDAAEPACARAS